jgi:hypothetical protein
METVTEFWVRFEVSKKRWPNFRRAYKRRKLYKCVECHGIVTAIDTGLPYEGPARHHVTMYGLVALNPMWQSLIGKHAVLSLEFANPFRFPEPRTKKRQGSARPKP